MLRVNALMCALSCECILHEICTKMKIISQHPSLNLQQLFEDQPTNQTSKQHPKSEQDANLTTSSDTHAHLTPERKLLELGQVLEVWEQRFGTLISEGVVCQRPQRAGGVVICEETRIVAFNLKIIKISKNRFVHKISRHAR